MLLTIILAYLGFMAVIAVAGLLWHGKSVRHCITVGCRRPPAPGWKVCEECLRVAEDALAARGGKLPAQTPALTERSRRA